MFGEFLENVRIGTPLVHCITNRVTINDCANMLLACGASPIMADDIAEVEEIAENCDALTINLGTLSRAVLPSMLAAGKRASALGHPIVLDPVGAGASAFRRETALTLMREIRFSAIRGNLSEIKALTGESAANMCIPHASIGSARTAIPQSDVRGGTSGDICSGAFARSASTRGVDANFEDAIDEKSLESALKIAKHFALNTGAIVAITGETDIVTDGFLTYCIQNGHPMMRKITGTGCQLSALIAAFLANCGGDALRATAAAVCAMGVSGERAFKRLSAEDGNATYRNYIIDAVYRLTAAELEGGANYEMR